MATVPERELQLALREMERRKIPLLAWEGRMGLEIEWAPLIRILGLDDEGAPVKTREGVGTRQTQSVASRLRAARRIGNADVDWVAMSTLTYASNLPMDQSDLRAFLRSIRDAEGKAWWAYITEFQTRGAVHYHVFWGVRPGTFTFGDSLVIDPRRVVVNEEGESREIFDGPAAHRIAETWIRVVGDKSPKFLRFQRGGITEPLRSPIGAGLYCAKEAAKRAQKSNRGEFRVSRWYDLARGIGREGKWVEIRKIFGDGISKCIWDLARVEFSADPLRF